MLVRCKSSSIGIWWCVLWLQGGVLIFLVLVNAQGWEGPLLYVFIDSASFIVGWVISVESKLQIRLELDSLLSHIPTNNGKCNKLQSFFLSSACIGSHIIEFNVTMTFRELLIV